MESTVLECTFQEATNSSQGMVGVSSLDTQVNSPGVSGAGAGVKLARESKDSNSVLNRG